MEKLYRSQYYTIAGAMGGVICIGLSLYGMEKEIERGGDLSKIIIISALGFFGAYFLITRSAELCCSWIPALEFKHDYFLYRNIGRFRRTNIDYRDISNSYIDRVSGRSGYNDFLIIETRRHGKITLGDLFDVPLSTIHGKILGNMLE